MSRVCVALCAQVVRVLRSMRPVHYEGARYAREQHDTSVSAKYHPLAQYLTAQPSDAVTLSFAEIEALLGAPLPRLAYQTGQWWWHPRGPQTRAWRGAGWRVQRVNLWWRTVTFRRTARR